MEQAAALIRYRFDTAEQLAHHLHLVDDAALLYLPDPPKGGAPVERVVVELVMQEPPVTTVVRGMIVSRAEGGSWLMLSRVSADQLVQLRSEFGDHFIAQVLDASGGGLRVQGARGLLMGASYDVRLLGEKLARSELGVARVVRLEGSEAGLCFALSQNPPVLRFVETLREAWTRAPELAHPAGGCSREAEPALPELSRPAAAV